MGGSDEEMLDEILFARARANASFAAAGLMAIHVHGGALDVAGMADGDGHIGIGNQVLDLDFLHRVHDLRAAAIAERFLNVPQLGDDHLLQFLFAAENFPEIGDLGANFGKFLEDFVDGEPR